MMDRDVIAKERIAEGFARRLMMAAGMLFAITATPSWGHDGKDHSAPVDQAAQAEVENADIRVRALPSEDGISEEERARNYFTDLPLVTQNGETVRFYSDVLRDRVVLINFIYTNCDQSCPVVTQQLIQVRNMLGERFGKEIFFVSISNDPERDTPEDMREFAQGQGADEEGWYFLTGKTDYVNQIITKFGQYSPVPEEHSSLLLAGNVQTRHWLKLRPNEPMKSLLYKLNSLADESTATAQVQ
ncbi:SCO family protein [Motiliproteus sp. SC1-56]|uniref:SCO family protein n=1 Tax=Motiliproteus sp. SC1-56 TaxID=2799565 RepID=UPI001A8D27CB|nr:SCO family protein [Motiliproteus sp. SC1-56]